MDKDVEHIVHHCEGCQWSNKSVPPNMVPHTAIPAPTAPWKHLGIDISGPFADVPAHHKNVVVLKDHCSGRVEYLLTGDMTTKKIVRWLAEQFARYYTILYTILLQFSRYYKCLTHRRCSFIYFLFYFHFSWCDKATTAVTEMPFGTQHDIMPSSVPNDG